MQRLLFHPIFSKKHMHMKDNDEGGRPTVKTRGGSFAVNSLKKQLFEWRTQMWLLSFLLFFFS